jgi:hypothetical protein
MNTALVFAPDLFLAVQNYVEYQDADFATACRLAILLSVGRVIFPAPPAGKIAQETESKVGEA